MSFELAYYKSSFLNLGIHPHSITVFTVTNMKRKHKNDKLSAMSLQKYVADLRQEEPVALVQFAKL